MSPEPERSPGFGISIQYRNEVQILEFVSRKCAALHKLESFPIYVDYSLIWNLANAILHFFICANVCTLIKYFYDLTKF